MIKKIFKHKNFLIWFGICISLLIALTMAKYISHSLSHTHQLLVAQHYNRQKNAQVINHYNKNLSYIKDFQKHTRQLGLIPYTEKRKWKHHLIYLARKAGFKDAVIDSVPLPHLNDFNAFYHKAYKIRFSAANDFQVFNFLNRFIQSPHTGFIYPISLKIKPSSPLKVSPVKGIFIFYRLLLKET